MPTATRRTATIAVTLLLAVLGALAALVVLRVGSAAAHDHARHATSVPISQKELALRQDMRKLWEDHVMWTRLAIISLTTDSPDTKATVARLLRNQSHIGGGIAPFYGPAAGRQLTALLREHILIAAHLIAAAKKGDAAGVATEQTKWQGNADEIAAFLSKANPNAWKLGEMKAMMRSHLRLTTAEVVARLQKKWGADVRAYDRIQTQILGMADMLSEGLVAQFPGRFQ